MTPVVRSKMDYDRSLINWVQNAYGKKLRFLVGRLFENQTALAPGEASDEAKLESKKALSKHSNQAPYRELTKNYKFYDVYYHIFVDGINLINILPQIINNSRIYLQSKRLHQTARLNLSRALRERFQ
ncbi:hypothetical protein BpHYR1_029871 [Brachionus plicatilis]|uniref:Uncharacterized protein n=1 Tax=Brachionus plicatilis TaxID=10195 RepID=A0A3M7SIV8_BRAPC|nr:hypothetical protein BpHYR1_029871 [Brachionus plicatilis]